MEYNTIGVVLKTLRCRWFGRTDSGRWQNAGDFDSGWEDRSKLMASLIPANTRVIDFGAGARKLEKHLGSGCTYIPADLVSRGADTIVFDLNVRPLPDLSYLALDVATLAGVIEYIKDVPSFLSWLAVQTPTCIASYGCAKHVAGSFGRARENIQRTGAGWVNSYTQSELLDTFKLSGFETVNRITWTTPEGDEQIFAFRSTEARYSR